MEPPARPGGVFSGLEQSKTLPKYDSAFIVTRIHTQFSIYSECKKGSRQYGPLLIKKKNTKMDAFCHFDFSQSEEDVAVFYCFNYIQNRHRIKWVSTKLGRVHTPSG